MAAREEIYEKIMAPRGAGEGCSSSNNLPAVIADPGGTVSIEIEVGDEESLRRSLPSRNKWLNSIMYEGDKDPLNGSQMPRDKPLNRSQMPKIQLVQPILRKVETNKKCYDPWVVSIGPCHHGKPELQDIERLKIQLVRDYVTNSKKKIDELYDEVVKVAGDARKCYAVGLTDKFDDEKFTQMMFLDGCFTLHYIHSIVEGKDEELKKFQHATLVRRDFLLLENQLPFLVLKVLLKVTCGIPEGETMITDFVKDLSGDQGQGVALMEQIKNFLVREHSSRSKSNPKAQPQDGADKDGPVHLLELVRRQLIIDPKAFGTNCSSNSCRFWYSRRSAKDFTTVGIHFKPSKTHQFTDIKFKSTYFSGILTLPRIIIDDTTKSMLLNLAAYEACPDNVNDFGVTSYICFMDEIIDHDEDVKLLRSKGILLNYLGSDKHVADLFNGITTGLIPSSHAYLKVKEGIEDHHQSSKKTWIAEWHHTYFRSPWTSIAVAAAILAISLSIIQTVLAAFQTYYTVHPPKD